MIGMSSRGLQHGTLTTIITGYRVGVALSSTQILLGHDTGIFNEGSASFSNNQFFGDAVFQNGFRITEAKSGLQALDFLNQSGKQIASLDGNGNLTVSGMVSSLHLVAQQDATTTASSTIATSLQGASDALKTALSALGETVIRVLGDAVYATSGIFKDIFAQKGHFDTLCVGSTCVSQSQLDALLANNRIQASNATSSGQAPSNPVQLSAGNFTIASSTTATSTSEGTTTPEIVTSSASSTPPTSPPTDATTSAATSTSQ
jgi:hypothetical protein